MMCKFYHECEYASSAAFTCTVAGGGDYCGKYRILVSECMNCCSASEKCDFPPSAREVLV
ncbi:hypothetical protein [Methanolobus sp.]|uniref:hypothetical protein n=1 Tax=Methanolobus sp. TaxID=1874737 RepID=UPI0025FD1E2C|nr:hypothetical protein [Methanolobus sp.]